MSGPFVKIILILSSQLRKRKERWSLNGREELQEKRTYFIILTPQMLVNIETILAKKKTYYTLMLPQHNMQTASKERTLLLTWGYKYGICRKLVPGTGTCILQAMLCCLPFKELNADPNKSSITKECWSIQHHFEPFN